jgi:hypothetical protein
MTSVDDLSGIAAGWTGVAIGAASAGMVLDKMSKLGTKPRRKRAKTKRRAVYEDSTQRWRYY